MTEEKKAKPKPLSQAEKQKAREEAKAKLATEKEGKKAEAKPAVIDGSQKPYVEEIVDRLRCKLSDKERLERLEDQNRTLEAIKLIEDEKKRSMSEFGEKIKERRGHMATISDELEHGIVKPVKCEVTYDFGKKKVSKVRLDTKEAEDRPMTDVDKAKAQAKLPFKNLQEQAEKAGKQHGADPAKAVAPAGGSTPAVPAGNI